MKRKSIACEIKSIDAEKGIYELMPSMETVDRDGDVLVAAGVRLDDYRKNPVVLWGHDYHGLPVAKTLEIEAVPGLGVKARIQFSPKGVDPHLDAVRTLWEQGFLNAASVGFIPVKGEPIPNERGEVTPFGGRRYTDWNLLEFSIVSVPANPDALRLGMRDTPDEAATMLMRDSLRYSGQTLSDALGGMSVEKRGRVLSAANEAKLRAALTSIEEVLSQLESADTPPADAGKTAPETETPSTAEVVQLVVDGLRSAFMGGS